MGYKGAAMNQGHRRDGGSGCSQSDSDRPDHGLNKPGEWPRRQPPPRRPPPSASALPAPTYHRAPPRLADHTYRDYSHFPASELPFRKKSTVNFPSKLHLILSDPEYSHIISWMPHGRAWKIHSRELLVRDVISNNFFAQTKYESFSRQLNGWGFKRLHQAGNDYGSYYHECFLRGLPHLTALMKRVSPNQGKQLPHVEGEPNFYEIGRRHPLPPPPSVPHRERQYPLPSSPSAPHHGHHDYYRASSDSTNSTTYGAPPDQPGAAPRPPAGYHDHYSYPPSSYSRPPPYYYHGGGDPRTTRSPLASPSRYAPYPYDPPPYSHPAWRHDPPPPYPYSAPHGPPFPTSPRHDSPPPSPAVAPAHARIEEEYHSAAQGSVQEERLPGEGETEESDPFEPIGLFQPVNDFGKK